MAGNDGGLINIEFETTAGSSVDAPGAVSGGQGSGPWPALVVALVVGGVLAALFWFSSSEDSSADLDRLASDEPAADDGENDQASAEDDEPDVDEFGIPESSSAAIAVAGVRLENARQNALAFDGGLLSFDEPGRSTERSTPSVVRSIDGVSWQGVDSEAMAGGIPNSVEYFWSGAWSLGGGFGVTALDFDVSSDIFISNDAIVWDRLPVEEILTGNEFHFEPLAITDDSIVGLRVGGSEVLTQILVDHTIFSDAAGACFVEGPTVFSCDGETEWLVNQETMDTELDTDVLLACLRQRRFGAPEVLLAAIDRSSLTTIGRDERIFPGSTSPTALPDGQIAAIEKPASNINGSACDGIEAVAEETSEFYIFDPAEGVAQRIALDPELDDENAEVLGYVPVGNAGRVLVRSADQFWSLDLDTSEWTMLDTPASGEQYVMSDSGTRVYGMDGADLLVLDLVARPVGLEIEETRVFVAVPTSVDPSFDGSPRIEAATDELVTVNFETGYWIVDVPSKLCVDLLAEVATGNGFVDGC